MEMLSLSEFKFGFGFDGDVSGGSRAEKRGSIAIDNML